MARYTLTAGLALRRGLRRKLDEWGVEYKEDKGILTSQFVCTSSEEIRLRIGRLMDFVNSDD